MDVDEAVQDAIETSKMQGGNLFFIIKKNVESDGRHKILHLLDDLLENPSDSTLEAFRLEAETFELRFHFILFKYVGNKLIIFFYALCFEVSSVTL